jgi:K+-transporting ATPase ATPase C chain
VVGSALLAQPFTKDEYFQPRPSAVSYDASMSGPSNLAPSNYALRNRVARTLGPIVKYAAGPKAGQLAGPDIEIWFKLDQFQGQPHLVAQWADAHNSLASAWVSGDTTHSAFVDEWAKAHPDDVAAYAKSSGTAEPQAADLAVVFFESFSKENPGQFPLASGTDIQSTFFDMWRQDHADAALQDVPGDLVTASGSGLDPHISLENARFQLDRVAGKWASELSRDRGEVQKEIERILEEHTSAPFGGLVGEKVVNVLEVNLDLRKHFGEPAS